MFKKKRLYGVFNVGFGDFRFSFEEMEQYDADLEFDEADRAYYYVFLTLLQYLKLKIHFWKLRRETGTRIVIRRLSYSRFLSKIQKKRRYRS